MRWLVLEKVTEMTGDNWREKSEDLEEMLRPLAGHYQCEHASDRDGLELHAALAEGADCSHKKARALKRDHNILRPGLSKGSHLSGACHNPKHLFDGLLVHRRTFNLVRLAFDH